MSYPERSAAIAILLSLAVFHISTTSELAGPLPMCYHEAIVWEDKYTGRAVFKLAKEPCPEETPYCVFKLTYRNGRWQEPKFSVYQCGRGPRGNRTCDPVWWQEVGFHEYPVYECYCNTTKCNQGDQAAVPIKAIGEIAELHGSQQPNKCYNASNLLEQCSIFGQSCAFRLNYISGKWAEPIFEPNGCSNRIMNRAEPCVLTDSGTNPKYTCYCNTTDCSKDIYTGEVISALNQTKGIHGPQPLRCYASGGCGCELQQCQHLNETCGFRLRYKFGKTIPSIYSATGCQPPMNESLDSCEKSGKNVYPQYDCRCGTTQCNQNDTTEAVAAAEKRIDALHAGQAKNQPGTPAAPVGLHG